jgi:hypothetical protein
VDAISQATEMLQDIEATLELVRDHPTIPPLGRMASRKKDHPAGIAKGTRTTGSILQT